MQRAQCVSNMRKTVTSKKLNRTFELNTEAEEAAINAGIAADPDTFEVTGAQFKKMRGRPAGAVVFDRAAFVQSLNNNKQPKTDSVIEMMRKNERYWYLFSVKTSQDSLDATYLLACSRLNFFNASEDS